MKSLKERALEWLTHQCEHHGINERAKVFLNVPVYIQIIGFADEPKIYILPTNLGLEFGYEAVQWDGPIPSPYPGMFKKHFVNWETIESMNKEKQKQTLFELLLKTINLRKRQYRKCKFCGEKVAIEHRFNQDTCHGCATEQYGVVY
ncbi:hypothetical protein [Neobacillus sp. Marseille-QA0830]